MKGLSKGKERVGLIWVEIEQDQEQIRKLESGILYHCIKLYFRKENLVNHYSY